MVSSEREALQQYESLRAAFAAAAPGTFNLTAALDQVGLNPREERDGWKIVQAVKSGGKVAALNQIERLIAEIRESLEEEQALSEGRARECDSCARACSFTELSEYWDLDDALMMCEDCIRQLRRSDERDARHYAYMQSPAGRAKAEAARQRREQERAEEAARQARHNASRTYYDER